MGYEVVIGLEIHLELKTKSKFFCSCSNDFGQEPNANCCPVCLGLPGSLPVLNKHAIELALSAAVALGSEIQGESRFDRKNYFYPDLPKAYQVSQYDYPLARGGFLEVDFDQNPRKIGLERIHLEEEAGKMLHEGDSIMDSAFSLVDYNRAGIPLLEIVTRPDLCSGKEARQFLEKLRLVLLYSKASDCKMEEGSLRCDANISLRPVGSVEMGTKTEVKNMNSFRSVELALNCEAERQEEILNSGGMVIQQTCHWDEEGKITVPLRSKEGSSDYRYFPDPDLLPLIIKPSWVTEITEALPELPDKLKERFNTQYHLGDKEIAIFIDNHELGEFFEKAAALYNNYDNLTKWIQGDFLFQIRETGKEISEVEPKLLVELLLLLDDGDVTRPVAKDLLGEIVNNGVSPKEVLDKKGLTRLSGKDNLLPLVERVISENPEAVDNYRAGKQKALAFLVGRAMALCSGRADPGELNKLLIDKL